jgi:predicted MFS family arabinose efflux permease
VLLVVVVVGKRQGLTSGEVGLLLATFGICVLAGSLVSPLLRRALAMRAILLLELWTWLGSVLFVVWPNVYVLMASILPTALAIPVTDSVVIATASPSRRAHSDDSTPSQLAPGPFARGRHG